MAKRTYLLVIEDDRPTMQPIEQLEKMTFAGVTYALVPIPAEPFPNSLGVEPVGSFRVPTTIVEQRVQAKEREALALFLKGGMTVNQIATKVRLSHQKVSDIIRQAGHKTGADQARLALKEALMKAGNAGLPTEKLTEIAAAHNTRSTPLLLEFWRAGSTKKLADRRWAWR